MSYVSSTDWSWMKWWAFKFSSLNSDLVHFTSEGGAVAQSVERATLGEEVLGLIPAVAARSLLFGLVSI